MLGFNISNITSSQYRESIDKSSIDIDYKPLSDRVDLIKLILKIC